MTTKELHTDALGYTYELVELKDSQPNLYERLYTERTPDGQYVVLSVGEHSPEERYYTVALFDSPYTGDAEWCPVNEKNFLLWDIKSHMGDLCPVYDKALEYIKSLYS